MDVSGKVRWLGVRLRVRTFTVDGRSTAMYAVSFINSFGNALTFLALFIYVQRTFGTASVAGAFLVQSIPAVLLARRLPELVPERLAREAYLVSQAALAIASAAMAVSLPDLVGVYAFLVATTVLRTFANPFFYAIARDVAPHEASESFFARIAAAASVALIVAPAIGGLIAATAGYRALLAIDAVTFVIAGALVACIRPQVRHAGAADSKGWREIVLATRLPNPAKGNRQLQWALLSWFLLAAAGAALNGVEFPVMVGAGLSDTSIGIVLAFWGLGSLIAFAAGGLARTMSTVLAGCGLVLGGALWVTGDIVASCVGFLLAGFFYALVSGALRSAIAVSIPSGTPSVSVWAYANQGVQLANVLIYGLVAGVVALASLTGGKVVLAAAGATLVLGLAARRVPADVSAAQGPAPEPEAGRT